MGLLNFIRTRLAGRHVARRFRSYVDVDLVQYVLDHPNAASEPPDSRPIDFALALVRDDNLGAVPALLGRIVMLARTHRGFANALAGPLVLIGFGFPAPDPESAAHRSAFAAGLIEQFGDRVKVLLGHRPALVGEIAGAGGFCGVVLDGFGGLLRDLTNLEFGQVREVGAAASPPTSPSSAPPGTAPCRSSCGRRPRPRVRADTSRSSRGRWSGR